MLEQYYRINKAIGLSIFINTDGSAVMDACELIASNNQIDFGKKLVGLTHVEDLKKAIDPKSILAVNLSGKGILTKQIEHVDDVSQNNFSKIMPNANFDDFYVQHFESGNQSFVSVVRKGDADKWLDQLVALEFQPLMLSLGVFPVQHVLSQLNFYGDEIIFNGHHIKRNEDGEWLGYQYKENSHSAFSLKIDNESIAEQLLLPYALAFQLILSAKLNPVYARVDTLEALYREQLSNNKLKVYGFIVLMCCFLLLLINFGVLSWLTTSNDRISNQVSRTVQSANDVKGINDKIHQKEALLQTLGWEANVNKSVLIDQVASLLPPEVTWDEVIIDPLDRSEGQSQKTLVFTSRKILITGMSDKIIPVNEWLARIKTRAWVKKVELKNYTINSELNTGTFTISIDY